MADTMFFARCPARFLLPEDGFSGGLCDLHLLAVTGGRERTRSEVEALLGAAGFVGSKSSEMTSLPSVLIAEKPLKASS